jgi:DNA-binding transcriptional LysR family regulator
MLNVQRMRVLREIAAAGTIAGAARNLFMTPSAVSQQMSVLEREVGTPVLERFGRSVRLTPAGERVVAHTERVLAVLEEAQADIDGVAKGVAGRLHTCAFPTAARALLVPALVRLRQVNPRLQVTLTDLEPEDSMPALKTGQLDLVLVYEFDHLPEPEDPGVERHLLMTEPMYVALPADHPRAAGPVSISELKDEQWIVGRDGSTFLEVQIRVANEAGFQPKVDLQSNDYQVILAAVAAGLGVALAPPLAFFAPNPGVVTHLPADLEVMRRIVAVIRRGSGGSPAISAALHALRQSAGEWSTAHGEAGMEGAR